jgi:hypothetical protein
MKYLRGKRAYLAAPIESCQAKANWRIPVIKTLTERFGLDVFDPFDDPKQQWVPCLNKARAEKDYETICRIADEFVHKDLQIVQKVDLLIAHLPKGVPTTGTHHEIKVASDLKTPVLLVCPDGKEHLPFWYFGVFKFHDQFFSSWDECYQFLADVEAGKYVDRRRWAYVYNLI